MGTLTEKAEWTEGVRYFERGVIVSGGPDAADNQPIQDLTNRTVYLKEEAALTKNQVETVAADLTGHIEDEDPHPQYVTTPEMETRIGRIEFQGQINSDWNATEGAAEILNKPVLAGVATSGQYDDLDGRPQNLATTDDITGLANDVTGLANDVTGLSANKLDKTSDGITVKYVTETFNDGTNWWRKWSDGWIEQGGAVGTSSSVTLQIPFKGTDYFVIVVWAGGKSAEIYASDAQTRADTTTTFYTTMTLNGGNVKGNKWYACGMGA